MKQIINNMKKKLPSTRLTESKRLPTPPKIKKQSLIITLNNIQKHHKRTHNNILIN
jgi:hypothetical protein